MVAAPYISQSTQDACKALGLGYIDNLTGRGLSSSGDR